MPKKPRYRFENMPRKLRYNCISNANTADKTQHINSEPAQSSSDDEDYNPRLTRLTHGMITLMTYMLKKKLCPVTNDGVTRTMSLSVKEAIVLPPSRQIILEFNEELQPIGQAVGLLSGFLGSLSADFQHFPINEDSWKTMDNALKEHAYDTIKEARNHLFHKVYDEEESFEENVKRKLSGIDAQQWRWFLNYRLKESTKEVITIIENQGGTLKEISVTDSLAQVLGKEYSGRVQGLELKAVTAEQKAEITELKVAAAEHKAEAAEDKAKIQTMENLVKYIIQQQGHTLPPEIDAQLKSLRNGAK
ncbi:hypothetical protein Ahy_B03g066677 [Arachis hypogaea]|uniref:Uncharacterized protein n=1 Tax=Arachis hypogaea TaxID=3818 RepID=A0A445A4M1_ARAHY|nr:hypothetical protein Ahy_B03g066677 [Arachis hypogaea]